MMKKRYSGSMTVEMALLFPLIFLLFIFVLRCLFHLGGRLIVRSLCGRCVMICQELARQEEEEWEQTAAQAAQQYVNQSGMPVRLDCVTVSKEEQLFFTRVIVKVSARHVLWGERAFDEVSTGYIIKGAHLRNLTDFAWESCEQIPGIGGLIQEYQQRLREFKNTLTG